ncbi:hypothetical protein DFP79_2453 [Marinomonas balearica]|uniref:Uncharacterized protein n=1 Tax=Marinomonas balearica TaxID=491947 RepID=A0A4R6M7T9_9GAMM|nr:hypothetical protein DFP79_2453 [Marinomonas balearica]
MDTTDPYKLNNQRYLSHHFLSLLPKKGLNRFLIHLKGEINERDYHDKLCHLWWQ